MSKLLADTYTLYLKTHNYHWNVTGPMFTTLHLLFAKQYNELALAVDEIVERIRALGESAPGTYRQFVELSVIGENADRSGGTEMLSRLVTATRLWSELHAPRFPSLTKRATSPLLICSPSACEGCLDAPQPSRVAEARKTADLVSGRVLRGPVPCLQFVEAVAAWDRLEQGDTDPKPWVPGGQSAQNGSPMEPRSSRGRLGRGHTRRSGKRVTATHIDGYRVPGRSADVGQPGVPLREPSPGTRWTGHRTNKHTQTTEIRGPDGQLLPTVEFSSDSLLGPCRRCGRRDPVVGCGVNGP